MHARRDDQAVEPSFQSNRQFDIRVVKENREEEHVLPEEERVERDADCRNLERAPWDWKKRSAVLRLASAQM